MTSDPTDVDLKAKFTALRSHDGALTPPFDATLARARARPATSRLQTHWPRMGAVGLLAAVLVSVWMARQAPTQIETGQGPQLAWRAPTDGLLTPAPLQAQSLAWDSLPTTALGRPSFNHDPELR